MTEISALTQLRGQFVTAENLFGGFRGHGHLHRPEIYGCLQCDCPPKERRQDQNYSLHKQNR